MRFNELDPTTQQALEAAAFRRLVGHLHDRPDVQNIDLMRLADFCRNCLGKWLAAAADEQGVALGKEAAREAVYGMPYAQWKATHQLPEGPPLTPTPLMPNLCYPDALAAIAWLCTTFGFVERAVHANDEGFVMHAQLTLGNAMLMISSARDDDPTRILTSARAAGAQTAAVYMVVDDVDAHHDRALAAGATISRPLTDEPYGGRDYVCVDPWGQLWSFGTYNPWS
jgi:uncharacterized glyoxalase superfamily protein PhnB